MFEQLVWKCDENINTELKSISVSDKYNIRSQTTKDKPVFTKTIEKTIDRIKSYSGDAQMVTFIYSDYLDNMLFGIINKLNYGMK